MSPLPAKRRKLDRASEANDLQAAPDISKDAPAMLNPTRTKRAQDGDDAALHAGALYKSSLFKLQVDELLREVTPKYEKRFGGLTEALHKLKGLVEGIEERGALSVS
jgi:U3 small nucleolar RNA-associated protein 22